ncbi:hypothetical protein E4T48_07690 [Aureobasidium sp. EXF-10727]|nr:hypothetical protein E4T48_07690 [Aureobasidium sp. EXF-10727]
MTPNITPSDLVLDNRRRLASPNERRCIARQDIGHQRSLVTAAVYASDRHARQLSLKDGKRYCIDEHPLLSTVVLRGYTESPEFATPKTLDLNAHIEIRNAPDISEDQLIEKLVAQIGDEQFESSHTSPPWKVVLVCLTRSDSSEPSRLLVLFANYHSHGDGRSGLAFHTSFERGLSKYLSKPENSVTFDAEYKAPSNSLLPPIEEGGKLTLSWSYLLSPLLGSHLPAPIASFLGLRTSWIPSEAGIWRGKMTQFDPACHSTGLVLFTVDSTTLSRTIQHCRAKRTTLTALLKHLIARSLNAWDGGAVGTDLFNTGVAIDLRHLFNGRYSRSSMMNCVSGHSEVVQYSHSQEKSDWITNPSSQFWQAARKTSDSLKLAASTLHDQPIGLLQYLRHFRPWTEGQIGKERDMSFEISNLGAYSRGLADEDVGSEIWMEKVIFAQPAKASGSLLNFNVVSIEGGPLVMTVTWQLEVLGLSEKSDETAFVRSVCSKLESSIFDVAATTL